MGMKVFIGYDEFEVVFKDKITVDGEECHGTVDWDTREIEIEKEAAPNVKRQTLLHEIYHVISHMFHLDLSEDTVDLLGAAHLMMIQNNPRFLEELQNMGIKN